MALQIMLNLIIAFVLMFLYGEWTFAQFVVGYIVGLIIIVVMRRFFPGPLYVRRVWAIAALLLLFLRELFLSTFAVVKQIIKPKLNLRPGIFAFRTDLRKDWEITLLACLITLTPGTLTLNVSDDQQVLYIHAMDIEDAKALDTQIKNTFERAIREVTR